MGEYPVPSVSWRTKSGKKESSVHFLWEFGTGDVACGSSIPARASVNKMTDRAITCQHCLYQIYDIPYWNNTKKTRIARKINFYERFMLNKNEDLVVLLEEEVKKFGSQKALAERIGISLGFMNDILHSRAPVTQQVAEYLGYNKVVGFVKSDNGRYNE